MAQILFFEKPGCANNTRQKAWLKQAGHEIEARSLLTHPWTSTELLSFLGNLPVNQWFNRAAPRIKSGEVSPESLNAEQALTLLLAEPLLIRRPLIQAADRREVGFDVAKIHAWLGLPPNIVAEQAPTNAEACLKPDPKTPHQPPECPPPDKT